MIYSLFVLSVYYYLFIIFFMGIRIEAGGTHLESSRPASSSKLRSLDSQQLKLTSPRKMNLSNHRRNLSVRAEYGYAVINQSPDFSVQEIEF